MKIALIITDYGSFNNFLGDLAVSLSREGHSVSIITSEVRVIDIKDKFNYKKEGVDFHYVDFPRGFNPLSHYRSSKKIHRILNTINPSLVHIHFTTGIFTSLFSGRLNYRTFGTFHGLGFPVLSGLKKQIFSVVEKFCFNRLDWIYVLNEVDLKAVRSLKYKNVDKYETVGLGCDLEVFNPLKFSAEQKKNLKRDLEVFSGDFVFAYTGRFVNFKGYDKAVRSFLSLYQKHPHAKLLLIGGHDRIHPTGLSETEEEEMKNCEGIVNIGFTNDVATYLSITDVFVFPSIKEGMPVCIIEALAMEVPVITADSRGCNEIVYDNYNGFVVDVEGSRSESVLNKMEELISNQNKIKEFKANIKKDRQLYDRKRYVYSEIKRYKEAVELKK